VKPNMCNKWRCLIVLYSLMIGANVWAQEPKRETKTISLKHADAQTMVQILHPYRSKTGNIDWERNTNTITISDDPATISVMQKMIEKFDVKMPQLQITLKMLLAEKSDKPQPVPPELGSIAKQLSDVFNYNSFSVMDTAFITAEANKKSIMMVGGEKGYKVYLETSLIEGEGGSIRLKYELDKPRLMTTTEKGTQETLQTLVNTTVELKDGETAILGASKIDGDGKALISIVTMKIKK
jgi:hypothetical protein